MGNATRSLRLGEKFSEGKEGDKTHLINGDDVRLYDITMLPPDQALSLGAKFSRIFFDEDNMRSIQEAKDDPAALQKCGSVSLIKALAKDDTMSMVKDLMFKSLFAKKGLESVRISNMDTFNAWFKKHPEDFLPLAIFICECYSNFFMVGDQ